MVIEKLKYEDIGQLIELYKDISDFKNSIEESTKVYEKIIDNDDYLLLVAKENEEVIGTLLGVCCRGLGCNGKPFLVIEDVVVKSNVRGSGIGTKLFKEMEKYSEKKQCAYELIVSSDFRKNAHRFYEKMGFIDGVRGFRKVKE